MRDCVFLVADSTMSAVFASFLERDRRCDTLGTGPFRFDAELDLVTAQGNDPDVFHNAHKYLQGHLETHGHAVVALDFKFGHHFTPAGLVATIEANLRRTGWAQGRFVVVLIQPELEAWIWQDHPRLDDVFLERLPRAQRPPSLRVWLREAELWPDGLAKPPDPKLAAKRAIAAFRCGAQKQVYTKICRTVPVRRCQDAAFGDLRNALRRWFPVPGGHP